MNVTRIVVGGVNLQRHDDDAVGRRHDRHDPARPARRARLKAISVVSWPTMGKIPPVKNQTLIAVPLGTFDDATGGLIAKFIDRDGNGVPNICVSLAGPDDQQRLERRRRLRVLERPARGRLLRQRRPAGLRGPGRQQHRSTRAARSRAARRTRSSSPTTARRPITATFTTTVERRPAGREGHGPDGRQQRPAVAGNEDVQRRHGGDDDLHRRDRSIPFSDGYVVWAGNVRRRRPADATAQPASSVSVTPGGTSAVVDRRARAEHPRQARHHRRRATTYSAATVRITPMTAGCGSTFGGTGLLKRRRGTGRSPTRACRTATTRCASATARGRSSPGRSRTASRPAPPSRRSRS